MATRTVEYIINLRDKFSGKLGKTGKEVNAMDKRMKSLRGSALRLGGALAGGFAITSVVRNAIGTIVDFDTELTTLKSITGLSAEEMGFFSDEAKRLGATVNTSSKDVVAAFTQVGSAQPELLKNKEALAQVTEQALILSKAAGIEGTEGANALTNAMNQFGASAKDAARFTDILATSQQKGSSFIADTSEALKASGAAAKAAGVSFETTNAAIQALAKGGIKGAEAGTKLRGVMAKLSSQSDREINPSMVGLSSTITELSKRNLTLKDAVELVGLESATGLLTLIDQNKIFQELDGSLNEAGNAMKQAEINMGSLQGRTKGLSVAWENLVLSIDKGEGIISDSLSAAERSLEAFVIDPKLKKLGLSRGLFQDFTELQRVTVTASDAFTKFTDEAITSGVSNEELRDKYNRLREAQQKLNPQTEEGMALFKVATDNLLRLGNAINNTRRKINQVTEAREESIEGIKTEQEEIISLATLNEKLSKQKGILESAAIGSTDFRSAQKEITRIQNQIALATGKKIKGAEGVGATTITSAAPKVFNTNVGSLIETVIISPTTLTEGVSEVKQKLNEALLSVLSDTQTALR